MIKRFSKLLPESNVKKLEFLLLDSCDFPWYLQKATTWKYNDEQSYMDSWPDSPQFTHNFITDFKKNSSFVDDVLNLLKWDQIKNSLENNIIQRMKGNLLLKNGNKFPNIPHFDYSEQHLVLLYYVNDNDGDTYFFDKKYDDEKKIESSLKVLKKETPKAGDFLLFDGFICHASSNPKNFDRRSVINFTLLNN